MSEIFLQYGPIALSAIAVIVSVLAWHKSRVIYEIVKETDGNGMGKVNDLLKTGRYAILHVQPDPSNVLRTIYILGRISNN
jgi:hypothetical protein